MKPFSLRPRSLLGMLFCLVVLTLFSACGGSATPTPGLDITPTPTHTTDTPPAGVSLGEQPCPALISEVSYWTAIVPLPDAAAVARVNCAHLRGDDSLQAVVIVGHEGTARLISVYVYDTVVTGTPEELFRLEGLYKGSAKISAHSTLLTAEVDLESQKNKDQPNVALQLDLFREFKWDEGTATLKQVVFPGFYPDLTRWQAEETQQKVDGGDDAWRTDAKLVGEDFSEEVIGWNDHTVSILEGGSESDAYAHLSIKTSVPGTTKVDVYMLRLNGEAGNIWTVTKAVSEGYSIDTPIEHSTLSSPTTITGNSKAFEGDAGKIWVFDHLYEDIGSIAVTSSSGNGEVTYTANVTYTSTFTSGTQEGVLAHNAMNVADSGVAGIVMIKVLIS